MASKRRTDEMPEQHIEAQSIDVSRERLDKCSGICSRREQSYQVIEAARWCNYIVIEEYRERQMRLTANHVRYCPGPRHT